VAEPIVAVPEKPLSIVRSVNTSKKLVTVKALESVSCEKPGVTVAIRERGLVGQPTGTPGENDPFGQMSTEPITAPSPVALELLSEIAALRKFAAVTSKWKNDSNKSPAAADWLTVKVNDGRNVEPPGVTAI